MCSYILRKVPANWKHPKDKEGNYIPLFDGSYAKYLDAYEQEEKMWNDGFKKKFEFDGTKLVPQYIPKDPEDQEMSFDEWHGEKCLPKDYRPDWPIEHQTHFQMYDNVTEGTPVSPVFEKVKDLARWLANELNDKRYPFTSLKWLRILTSDDPSTPDTIFVIRKKLNN